MIDVVIPGNDANRRRGQTAQARGGAAEDHITGMCGIYLREGKARIRKLHVPTSGGPRARKIIGSAPLDFGGHITPSGRAVYAELKSIADPLAPELQIGDKSRQLEPHQIEELAACGRGGALSIVLWYRDVTLGVCHWSVAERFMLARRNIPATSFRWLNNMNFDWLPVALAIDKEANRT